MVPLSTLESIACAFPMHKIIFCGDLGQRCVYQLPPVNCDPEDFPTIQGVENSLVLRHAHVKTFSTNHRCKCPKVLQLLSELRRFIDGSHPCASDSDTDATRMRKILRRGASRDGGARAVQLGPWRAEAGSPRIAIGHRAFMFHV